MGTEKHLLHGKIKLQILGMGRYKDWESCLIVTRTPTGQKIGDPGIMIQNSKFFPKSRSADLDSSRKIESFPTGFDAEIPPKSFTRMKMDFLLLSYTSEKI